VRERFGDADGLRALAILAVVFYEAIGAASPQRLLIHPALARLAADAGQGLTLFFVLSGFTLAYPALAATRQDGRSFLDIGRYAVKRALRIYPAYLALLGLTLILPDLALRYGLPGLAGAAGTFPTHAFVQNALFTGDGLGNDGFRALAIVARWYLVFPLLLLLWTRAPWIFAGIGVLATIFDLTTPAHSWYLSALAPFMLGIVAAEIRVQHHRFERYALLLALGAGAVAVLLEPFEHLLPGPQAYPDMLRVDPLWAVALFGVVAGAGVFRIVERALSLSVFRILGAASFAISLIVFPVTNFVVHQSQSISPLWRAANSGALALVVGFVLWQVVDRWFADGPLRRDVAELLGPWIDRVLSLVRADRLILGPPPPAPEPEIYDDKLMDGFYAPPPRALPADLAVVSKKSGTPEELAAEILETKKRLSERSALIFSEPKAEPVFEKPGFYRKPTNGVKPHGDEPHADGTPVDLRRLPRENTDFQPIDFTKMVPPDEGPAGELPPEPPAPRPHHHLEIVQEPQPEPAPQPHFSAPPAPPEVVAPAPSEPLYAPEVPPEPEPASTPAAPAHLAAPTPPSVPTPAIEHIPAPTIPAPVTAAVPEPAVATEPAPQAPPAAPPAAPRQPIRLRIAPNPGNPQNPRNDSAK
jgi:peptidoglycan/LPS O-acetylase OafA/YrhL